MCSSTDRAASLFGSRFARIAVTDRRHASASLEKLAPLWKQRGVSFVVVREKDLDETAYERELLAVKRACDPLGIAVAGHTFVEATKSAGCRFLHLPLPQLVREGRPEGFDALGSGIHTLAELHLVQNAGADYVFASPIFQASCKPGIAPAGLAFLEDAVAAATVAVIALGGITDETEPLVRQTNAAGAARMSDYMR